jgi:7-cyano-7-deazaguanine synthase
LVLLSGGLDSAANLALCAESDLPVLALTVRYGQKAAAREVQAARALCEFYGVEHQVLELGWLGSLGGSALTEPGAAPPRVEAAALDDARVTSATARAVWVPNRNGVLINVAAAFAERRALQRVVVGFNREEAATFPDNSSEFLDRASAALRLSTANGVEVFCYTTHLDKIQIVERLGQLRRPFPFDRIWSCYSEGPLPCGVCESCRRLERALASRR